MRLEYRILATGSKGNSVLIDDILIDAGLSRKKLETMVDSNNINHVFISHRHADHCNLPLVRYFIEKGTDTYLPQGVIDKLKEEGKCDPDEFTNVHFVGGVGTYECGDIEVTTIPQKHHSIINFAFVLIKDGLRYLYATDLDTLRRTDVGEGLYHLDPFDVIFLEGNYDEEWLREYIVESVSILDDNFDFDSLTSDELNNWVRKHYQQLPRDMSGGLYRAVQNMRHLSKQQARGYVRNYLKPDGKYYEIHRSSLFYEKPNDWDGSGALIDGW